MLPRYINSSTGQYWVDHVTVTIHCYWQWCRSRTEILDLCLGPRDAETKLGSFFIHCCESGAEAFLLVNEQGDVVSITDVRESMLTDLDADSTTDVLHDEIHCSAEQPGSVWGLTHSLGEGFFFWGGEGARVTKPMSGYVPASLQPW